MSSDIESWRELPGGEIKFTMKRLRSTVTVRIKPPARGITGGFGEARTDG